MASLYIYANNSCSVLMDVNNPKKSCHPGDLICEVPASTALRVPLRGEIFQRCFKARGRAVAFRPRRTGAAIDGNEHRHQRERRAAEMNQPSLTGKFVGGFPHQPAPWQQSDPAPVVTAPPRAPGNRHRPTHAVGAAPHRL